MPDSDTPVLDTLALMTAASLENSDLPPREFMIARIAALAEAELEAELAEAEAESAEDGEETTTMP